MQMNMFYRAQPCYVLSPVQLREMWAFDNLCASQTMQIPLRHCKEIEHESTAGTFLKNGSIVINCCLDLRIKM